MNKFRERLIKFGMEQEYLDWKTNLPIDISQIKVGSLFVVTQGPYEGRKGKIIRDDYDRYVTDMKSKDGSEIVAMKDRLNLIKLIK